MSPGLDTVQRWMQTVITHPDGVEPGIGSDPARRQLDVSPQNVEHVICRSNAMTSIERLSIYANAYYARLLECLREEFPVLAKTLGQEAFDDLAFGYLQSFPSKSYTLARLGDCFTEYLAQTRPLSENADGGFDWPQVLIELATLEWNINQVFDGPGIEGHPMLSAADLQRIGPQQWAEVRLTPAPCLRLLQFQHPINDFYSAVRNGDAVTPPEPRESYLALHRRDFVVRRHALSRSQHDLLAALLSGATVGRAIAGAQFRIDASSDELVGSLRQWFQAWWTNQFFVECISSL